MKYRREIDGLRAIAVVAVILFHAGFKGFAGGYVGVDVFFVISGYLIASIIFADKEKGTFSLRRFYERRARRLLPALFLVMLVCLPIASVLMLPDDLENFGQSLVATTFFSNNVLLWITSGYWNLANEFKPLLHTWSLGVEEQYYFVFPLLVMATWRAGKKSMAWIFVLLATASLLGAQVLSKRMPSASFYLLPTRFWELLIGVLIAMWLPGRPVRPTTVLRSEVPAALGLLMILVPVFLFGAKTVHPGFLTLLPTLGTGLLIVFATERTAIGRLLGARPLVGLGLISYSAYLWHQPIFAFLRLASLDRPSSFAMAGAMLVAIAVAALSWKFVEQPLRHGTLMSNGRFFGTASAFGLALPAAGLVIYLNSGFVHLWAELNTDIRAAGRRLNADYNMRPFQYENRPFSLDLPKRKVLVLGNSYARDFINAGLENGYFSNSELSYSSTILDCVRDESTLEAGLRQRIAAADYMIFGVPAMDLACWDRDLAMYRKLGARRIIVIGTKNFGWNLNAVMRLDASTRYAYRTKVLPEVWEANQLYASKISPDVFVNLLGMLADQDARVPVFTEDRKFISQDRDHLTRDGARFIGRMLFEHPLLRELK